MFDPSCSHGVTYICCGCGTQARSPMPNDKQFDEFVNQNVDQQGCKQCKSDDYFFKDYRGYIYEVAYKIKK